MLRKATSFLLLISFLLASIALAQVPNIPDVTSRFPNAIEITDPNEFVDAVLKAFYSGEKEVNIYLHNSREFLVQSNSMLYESLDYTKIPNGDLLDKVDNVDGYGVDTDAEPGTVSDIFVKVKAFFRTPEDLASRFPKAAEAPTSYDFVTACENAIARGEKDVYVHFTGSLRDLDEAIYGVKQSLPFIFTYLAGLDFGYRYEDVSILPDREYEEDNDIWAHLVFYVSYQPDFQLPIWGLTHDAEEPKPSDEEPTKPLPPTPEREATKGVKPIDIRTATPKDIPSDWALSTVDAAINNDLVTKTVASNYGQPITREEFAELVVNLYEVMTGKVAPMPSVDKFVDTDNPYVLKANNLNIVSGTGENTFSPKANITREQLACMLTRYLSVVDINPVVTMEYRTFVDEAQISDYARSSVQYMNKLGILGGVGEGRVEPQGITTREQAIALVLRVFNNLSSYMDK